MPRGRRPKTWTELFEDPLNRPRTEEELKEYEAAVTMSARSPTAPAKRRRGRPRKPETERDLKMQEACGNIRWMMELHAEAPELQALVESWLLETRLSASSIWEEGLHPDDWARVSATNPDFRDPVRLRIVEKLVRSRLDSTEKKLDTVLRVAAHQLGFDDPDDVEALRLYREKGSATERRRRARGE